MEHLITLLTLKPIFYGFIGMLISGLAFPLSGVIIVRNSLIPMRYMLMHGVLLGGIFSIALGLPLLPVVIVLNIVLVLIMIFLNRGKSISGTFSAISTTMMVLTMGIASMLSHIFDVPAKDTLELLWGSPFALTKSDLFILLGLAILIIFYIAIFFRHISMCFFDADIAYSMGVNVKLHNTIMLLITALIISVAMKLLGALLIDSLLILPVVSVSKNARGLKDLFWRSSITGFLLSFVGYFLALIWNLPVSGVLAVLSFLILIYNRLLEVKKCQKN